MKEGDGSASEGLAVREALEGAEDEVKGLLEQGADVGAQPGGQLLAKALGFKHKRGRGEVVNRLWAVGCRL